VKQINPIPDVFPVHEHDWSVYPDKVRVLMKNGVVVDYYRAVEQPAPVLKGMLDSFSRTCFGGYKYKEKGRGKRSGRRHEDAEV